MSWEIWVLCLHLQDCKLFITQEDGGKELLGWGRAFILHQLKLFHETEAGGGNSFTKIYMSNQL